MSAGQQIADVLEDGQLTREELNNNHAVTAAGVLNKWGIVRDAVANLGNLNSFQADGIGSVTDVHDRQEFNRQWRALFEDVAFPIVPTDRIASSGLVTEADRRRVQFGGDPQDVVDEVQEHNQTVTDENDAETSSGVSPRVLTALAGAVALALAVLGGN